MDLDGAICEDCQAKKRTAAKNEPIGGNLLDVPLPGVSSLECGPKALDLGGSLGDRIDGVATSHWFEVKE